ncbi:methyltransferase domain-containing protein [Colletotrichum tofieldiae]|nr:methyltransferase domain-containing protein [Colletotrichum tofieldiae]
MSGNYNDTPIVQQPNAAIEAVNDPNDDSEFDLEEWDAKSISSYSLNSSLYAHENSNGRSFHRYHHGRYPMPNDQTEQNREDMKHAMLLELTFYIDDAEDGEWLLGDSYDFIHLRSVAPVFRRLDRVLNKAYE